MWHHRTIFLTAVITALFSVPAAVWASHQFSDVGNTHPFHNEISAVAGAGITTGFPDGTFRPSDPVTRQAMAAFFERGAGRADFGDRIATVNSGQVVEVTSATLDAGATQSGNGFALLQGNAYAYTSGSTNVSRCPCLIELRIIDGTNTVAQAEYLQVPGTAGADGYVLDAGSIQAFVPLPADTIRTYRLVAYGWDADATQITVAGQLSATYVPFSGDGDNTTARTLRCPRDDGYEQNDAPGFSTAAPYFVDGGFSSAVNAIVCPGDEDWFRIDRSLAAGDRVQINTTFAHAEGDIDVCLVRDPSTEVTCATSKTNNEAIDFTIATPGHHYVRVLLASDAGAFTGNTYHLSVFRTAASSAAEPTTERSLLPGPDDAPSG